MSKEAKPAEVIILGTIHGAHNENKSYGADVVSDILRGLKPDVICVELYSRFFKEDGMLTDEVLDGGCPENRATNDVANELGVRQLPFDREGRNEYYAEHNYFERERRANDKFEQWMDELARTEPDSVYLKLTNLLVTACESQHHLDTHAGPELINSAAYDGIIRIKHTMCQEILPTLLRERPVYKEIAEWDDFSREEWHERNSIMADNIERIAAGFPEGRAVVVTGAEHRHALRDRLANRQGIVLKEFWEV